MQSREIGIEEECLKSMGSFCRIKLLGPVGLVSDDGSLVTGGPRLRILLAVLAVKAGETVTSEQFVDELWGEDTPVAVENALQALIARLRKQMQKTLGEAKGRDLLITRPGGYQLKVDPEDLDVARFDRLAASARTHLATDPVRAAEELTEALALWSGSPLQGVTGGPICRSAVLRYEENWLAATESKIELDLSTGRDPQVISELKRMAFLYPWRERLTDMLMVSLYRVGRQAEAVATYNKARSRMIEELGMEPSPQLQHRVREILNQAPSLHRV